MPSGFLPARGSFMLDMVAVAMVLITIVLLISVIAVRYRRMVRLHRALQLSMAIVLAIAVVAFEIDVRFFTDWRRLAKPSPFFASGLVDRLLWIHLCFAIPTPLIWGYVIWGAMKNFRGLEKNESFAAHSAKHRFWGRIAALCMLMTAITGWLFYWVAFVC